MKNSSINPPCRCLFKLFYRMPTCGQPSRIANKQTAEKCPTILSFAFENSAQVRKQKTWKKVNLPPRLFRDLPKAKVLDKRQLNGSIGRRDLFTRFLVLQRSLKNFTEWGIDFFSNHPIFMFLQPSRGSRPPEIWFGHFLK